MGYNLKHKGAKIDELLDKAGTALQEHQDISGKLNNDGVILNIKKVTSLPPSPDPNTLYVIVED